ncbi:DNA gyrase subunit A [Planctomycetes bacterium Pan216]|uniref:DNA gyrase subunit A n=1 Tax=Kolteria novifilia TaxID=2527975 RepID=A0A518B2D2_9BACT|nr:DNA gyrase subunit A [Planctomycetes bacterium Pan216]
MSTDDPGNGESEQESPSNTPESDAAVDGTADEGLQELQIDEDLRESYLSYAMSVIISRALPESRDGLKPSQRRILLSMSDLNLGSRSKESKCARICGDASGKYHPHGESVVYPTLVRMVQPFNTRYPLISGQGNFGSIDGLPPAAMRYTEAKLSPIAEEMLADIEKDTVDTIPNYDESREEAVVLPSRFPNLICNGSQGIAVGMATSIPPHNLSEISDACVLLIDNPETTFAELLQCVPGPDFPTGGIIRGRRGIIEGYRTGRSTITLRAKTHFEEVKGGRTNIIVTELPYMQQKIRLIQKIAQAVKDDRIPGISNVQDHSNRKGIRIVIELKRDADPNIVENQLFQFTPLQDTFSVIMLSLVNSRPQTLSLKQMLTEFIQHRVTVIRRRTQYLLRKARHRAHVVEGLLIALSSIDEVIERIRRSSDVPDARQALLDLEVSAELLSRALGDEGFTAFQAIMGVQASYNLTRVQADQILQMQLQRLTALEQDKLLKEYESLRDEITEYERLLGDEKNILAVVREDMLELKRKYGDPRRTEITEFDGDIDLEDLIPDETNVVTVSHAGYIKRLHLDTYRTQGRGGRGITGGQTKEGDFLADVFTASTHNYLLFFTDLGRCHWLKVYDIPSLSRTSQGRAIVNLLNLRPDEKITSYLPISEFDERFLLMVTRRGIVKKTPLEAFSRPRKEGIIAVNLDENDQLVRVLLVGDGNDVILSTARGMSIRFAQTDVRSMGRTAHGVRGIDLQGEDVVVGGVVIHEGDALLTVCEHGFGKRTPYEEYRTQRRGGKGLIDIKTTERNGPVVAVASVSDDDDVMFISAGGMVVRISAKDISTIGRNTQGVTLMRIGSEDRVVSVAKIASEDVQVNGDEEGDDPNATDPSANGSGTEGSETDAPSTEQTETPPAEGESTGEEE